MTDYRSPYGTPAGLAQRLGDWCERLRRDRTMPWPGMGLLNDLEVAMQILNMREFAEWLRDKGDPAHARFADEILQAQDALAFAGHRAPTLAASVDALDVENRAHEAQAMVAEDMRKVLVEYGALSPGDKETPLPDLLRALLS